MKKVLCMIICLLVFLSGTIISVKANDIDNASEIVYISSSPILYSRSGEEAVRSNSTVIGLYVIVRINGEYYSIVEYVSAVFEYIDVPLTNNQVEAYRIESELLESTIDSMNSYFELCYPNAQCERSATGFYNCHSYAWFSTSMTNNYWINYPEEFYQDNSAYEEVTTPYVGDIICYYASNGENLHSGVVTEINNQSSNKKCGNSNTVEVISKWGSGGLYEHNGYECPYTQYGGGAATSVKYFHKHTFIYRVNGANASVHTVTCSACNDSYVDNHTYKSFPDGSHRCTKCGYFASGQIIMSETPKPVAQ